MNRLLAVAVFATTAAWLSAADPAAIFVAHDKVAESLAKGGPLVTRDDLKVQGSHRNGPGQVEVHDKETDVIYVVDGSAMFITGGTMVGGKQTTPGQYLGTDIKDGETHHLAKGDVMVVPAGTPHWFKDVHGEISYYVVKVLKQ